MLGLINRPAKRLHQETQARRANAQPSETSHLPEGLGAVNGSSEVSPAAKKRRMRVAASNAVGSLRRGLAYISQGSLGSSNIPGTDSYQPDISSPIAAVYRKRGRPPTYEWTRTRDIALIRLVIKTDLPFDYIHLALREPDFSPSEQTCRKRWETIFQCPPGSVRIKNPKVQEKRYRDLKGAYQHYRKHELSLSHTFIAAEDNGQSVEPDCHDRERLNSGLGFTPPVSPESGLSAGEVAKAHLNQQRSMELSLPLTPMSNPNPLSPLDEHSTEQDPTYPRKRTKGFKPIDRAQCAGYIGLSQFELERLMYGKKNAVQQLRSSWKSRISERFSRDMNQNAVITPVDDEAPPLPAPQDTIQDSHPRICKELQRAFTEGQMQDFELGLHIAKLIVEGEDVNTTDEEGVSPLHLAAARGCLPVLLALLHAGANGEAITKSGESVSAYSRRHAHNEDISPQRLGYIEMAREHIKYLLDLNPVLTRFEHDLRWKHRDSTPQNDEHGVEDASFSLPNDVLMAEHVQTVPSNQPANVAEISSSRTHAGKIDHSLASNDVGSSPDFLTCMSDALVNQPTLQVTGTTIGQSQYHCESDAATQSQSPDSPRAARRLTPRARRFGGIFVPQHLYLEPTPQGSDSASLTPQMVPMGETSAMTTNRPAGAPPDLSLDNVVDDRTWLGASEVGYLSMPASTALATTTTTQQSHGRHHVPSIHYAFTTETTSAQTHNHQHAAYSFGHMVRHSRSMPTIFNAPPQMITNFNDQHHFHMLPTRPFDTLHDQNSYHYNAPTDSNYGPGMKHSMPNGDVNWSASNVAYNFSQSGF